MVNQDIHACFGIEPKSQISLLHSTFYCPALKADLQVNWEGTIELQLYHQNQLENCLKSD